MHASAYWSARSSIAAPVSCSGAASEIAVSLSAGVTPPPCASSPPWRSTPPTNSTPCRRPNDEHPRRAPRLHAAALLERGHPMPAGAIGTVAEFAGPGWALVQWDRGGQALTPATSRPTAARRHRPAGACGSTHPTHKRPAIALICGGRSSFLDGSGSTWQATAALAQCMDSSTAVSARALGRPGGTMRSRAWARRLHAARTASCCAWRSGELAG